MPRKPTKKTRQGKAKRSPTSRRTRIGRAGKSATLLVRLGRKLEKVLSVSTESLIRAYATLHDSKQREAARAVELEVLLNTSPIPIWIARTADCRVITGNRAAAELIGAPLETNVSQTPGEHAIKVPLVCFRAGRELAPQELPMQRAGASGEPVSDEFEMVFPDGRVKCLSGRAVPLKDASGTVTGVIASFADITERKQEEEVLRRAHDELEQRIRERTAQLAELNTALEDQLAERRRAESGRRESNERLRAILDNSPGLMFIKDLQGRYLHVNRQFERTFHITCEEIAGKRDDDVFPPEQAAAFRANDLKVLEAGAPLEFEEVALHDDGPHTSIVFKFPLSKRDGKPYALCGITTDITNRKRMEEALREAEEKYHSIFDNAVEGIFQSTPGGRYLSANPALARMYGYDSPEDLINSVRDIAHEVYVNPECRTEFTRLLEQRRVLRGVEYEVYRKDGSTIWISESARAVSDERGQIQYYEGTVEDITERKRAEEAHTRLGAIVECSYDAVISVADGCITSWNPAAERLWGYSAEETLGKPVNLLVPPPRAGELKRILELVLQGERLHDIETEGLRKDGQMVTVSLTVFPVKNMAGSIAGASAIVRDVTEVKRAEQERQKLVNDRLLLLESTGEGIYGIDLQGRCTFMNRAAAKMLGYRPEEVLGEPMHDLVHHSRPDGSRFPSEECRIYQSFRSGQGCQVDEEVLWRKDGTAFPAQYSSFPIVEDETIVGAVVTFIDITERRRSEGQLQRTLSELRTLSRRLDVVREEERTRIARELHDELGVRLTCLKLDLTRLQSLIGEPLFLREKMEEKVRSMTGEVDSTIVSIQRLVAELRPGILDDLGLVAAIEWQCQDFERRSGTRCFCEAPQELIRLDRAHATAAFRICQEALMNVARHSEATCVGVLVEQVNGELLLEIQDDGRGIPADKLTDSASLGLLGMRERARSLGGQVEIAGSPGKGTTVTLRLPCQNSEARWELKSH
jgi:PAS domain S-box-containing protein